MHKKDYHYTKFSSPLGSIGLIFFREALSYLFFQNHEEARITQTLQRIHAQTGYSPIYDADRFCNWKTQLNRYFSGETVVFNEPVFFMEGTPLQKRIWGEIARIPQGALRSYQAVASRLGKNSWARAVGRACACNPIPIIIPCHRVVRQNGLLGGYRYGIKMKKQLLALEGLNLKTEEEEEP